MDTGEWIPQLPPGAQRHRCGTCVATPDGKLIVGGEFTTVNGAANTSAHGRARPGGNRSSPGWRASVTNPNAPPRLGPQVQALDYQDGWHLPRRPLHPHRRRQHPGHARHRRPRGSRPSQRRPPDGTWKPHFDGTIVELDAAARVTGSTWSATSPASTVSPSPRFAAVTTARRSPARARPRAVRSPRPAPARRDYQQVVYEVGNDVWVGGAQHILQPLQQGRQRAPVEPGHPSRRRPPGHRRDRRHRLRRLPLRRLGVRRHVQLLEPGAQSTRPARIKFVGAFDAAHRRVPARFGPHVARLARRHRPWALDADPDGCLWVGGDINPWSPTGTAYQWLRRLRPLCQHDATAPTTPTNLTATRTGGRRAPRLGCVDLRQRVQLPDPARRPRHRDRGVEHPHVHHAGLPADVKYFVRAVDSVGNYSATTAGPLGRACLTASRRRPRPRSPSLAAPSPR